MPHPFVILWSLAVEEHFYIFFPLLVVLFGGNPRKFCLGLIVAVLCTLLWRQFLYGLCQHGSSLPVCGLSMQSRFDHSTDTRFDTILLGGLCVLAAGLYRDRLTAVTGHPVVIILATAALLVSFLYRDEYFRSVPRYLLQGLGVSVLLVNIEFGNWRLLRRILSWKALLWVGRLSYSLYLMHFAALIISGLIVSGRAYSLYWFAVFFPLMIGLALFSYHFIERPTLRWRRRYGSKVAEIELSA